MDLCCVYRILTEGGNDFSGAESIPRSLSAPLAVADHLYDEAQIASRASATESAEDRKDTEANVELEAQTHESTPSVSHLRSCISLKSIR